MCGIRLQVETKCAHRTAPLALIVGSDANGIDYRRPKYKEKPGYRVYTCAGFRAGIAGLRPLRSTATREPAGAVAVPLPFFAHFRQHFPFGNFTGQGRVENQFFFIGSQKIYPSRSRGQRVEAYWSIARRPINLKEYYFAKLLLLGAPECYFLITRLLFLPPIPQ